MLYARVAVATTLIVGLLAGNVEAGLTVTYSDDIPLTPMNWSDTVSIPQFDPILGILQQVDYTLGIEFEGTMNFENLDVLNPSPYTLRLTWLLGMQPPGSAALLAVGSFAEENGVVGPFDGVIDYAGPSGVSFSITDTGSDGGTALPADLALWIGTGILALPVDAMAETFVDGGSPATSFFTSAAAAEVTVTYTYIPEPATISMLALGGLTTWHRRRR